MVIPGLKMLLYVLYSWCKVLCTSLSPCNCTPISTLLLPLYKLHTSFPKPSAGYDGCAAKPTQHVQTSGLPSAPAAGQLTN